MNIIDIKNITKIYKTGDIEVRAIQDINLSVTEKSFVAFIGPSGSGKTTLLNCIGCLSKPTKGEIYIEGQLVNKLNRKNAAIFRGNHLGFVFQDFNLIPVLTVFENIEYPLIMIKRMKKKARRERVLQLLEQVEMLDQKDKYPNQISGGQKQRVAVARALVGEPKIVLADEPTANLDKKTALKVIEIMRNMRDCCDTTFIFSTHDPKVVGTAETIFTLEDGRIINKKGGN